MSAAWVAGRVRAQALARRRLGPGRTRLLAESASLADAVSILAATPYGHGVTREQDLASAQRGVAETLLWHLRVLAGWLPRGGATALRTVAAWFELANIDALLQRLEGRPAEEPYVLGALGTAWPRLEDAPDIAALRERLTASSWGDPGDVDPWTIRLVLRLSWASRIHALGGRATAWAAGAAGVLVAGERFGAGRDLPRAALERADRMLGASPVRASALGAMAAHLGRDAHWALAGIDDPADLWRAEGPLLETPGAGRQPAAARLGVRCRAGPRCRDRAGGRRLADPGRAGDRLPRRRADGSLRCAGLRICSRCG